MRVSAVSLQPEVNSLLLAQDVSPELSCYLKLDSQLPYFFNTKKLFVIFISYGVVETV